MGLGVESLKPLNLRRRRYVVGGCKPTAPDFAKGRGREPKSTSQVLGRGVRDSWGRGAHGVWQEGEASLLAGSCATERGRRLLRQYPLVGTPSGRGPSAANREAESPRAQCWRQSRHPLSLPGRPPRHAPRLYGSSPSQLLQALGSAPAHPLSPHTHSEGSEEVSDLGTAKPAIPGRGEVGTGLENRRMGLVGARQENCGRCWDGR